ncbi:hypothetical protein C2869_17055 [Saccharobesus litoralis]|uniref:Uncharacterized protein n=1 Tax=Saccharobesus litoralis TaxID=2172099 RepID=A0A2S0VUX9_9ALTE|nr:hypothetical protein [Saccharobesus litoralis]AWB68027.1 hypothetical protein C2869_17055 [Saccharobesus litoralis]
MIVNQFIELKKKQLSYYVREFCEKNLPYNELNLFLWDTLEEWTQVTIRKDEPYSQVERVFWHLIHLLSYWPEQQLLQDDYLVEEMQLCVEYLEGQGCVPFDCVGIRP